MNANLNNDNNDYVRGYKDGKIAGATTENDRAQKRMQRLIDVLEKIVQSPVPANEREYMSWFVTAKNIAGGAISEWEADNEIEQWKSGKGKDEPKEECTCSLTRIVTHGKCYKCPELTNPQQSK